MSSNDIHFQLSSIESADPNEVLDRILYAWALKHGITIEPLEELMKKWPDRYQHQALGVADFLNGVIGISENAKIDTLAEEIAHFAIELRYAEDYNDYEWISYFPPIRKRLNIRQCLNRIHRTPEYFEVKYHYEKIYSKDIDFRKEALAKILSKEIVYLFQVKEIIKKKQSKYESFKNIRIGMDDFIYFLNRTLGISTVAKNDIERTMKILARMIINQESIRPKYSDREFGVARVKDHHTWPQTQEKESDLLY